MVRIQLGINLNSQLTCMLSSQAIFNEKNAPEVLHYRDDLMDELQALVKQQEEAVEDLEKDHRHELKRTVFSLELKRAKYLLRLYLRTRLFKIESQAAHILGHQELIDRLSPLEQSFTQDYFIIAGKHLKASCLDQLPDNLQSLVKSHSALSEGNDLIFAPNLDCHVFCSLLDDVGSIQLDEEQEVDMKAGDLFIIRYEVISHLVQQGRAVLI
jgi:GINS complex subunit 4